MRLIYPVLTVSLAAVRYAAALDTSLVRSTEPLSPEEQKKQMHVPEGFEIQLVAAEPEINKPMNLAFDAKGRMWVTSSVEYPYAAKPDRWVDPEGTRVRDSRDSILIFEDTNGDGRADKRKVFATGLNIPIGILPWGKGCIAWSIPNICYFEDTDGDDEADKQTILFGPLGYERDVHGNCASLRAGPDGWIYGTHGFSNTSKFVVRPENLKGARPGDPGTVMEVNSGNVYRFRPDGSRIELFTGGQVNPFGLAWDSFGNLYSADCHSAPIYQLLHGAVYPSFGKPDDGIGFGPAMIRHDHSSTGICGIVCLDGHTWGPEWEKHILIGNVVTSRVNCDRLEWKGATPEAIEKPDFLSSDDPWFRPVDLRFGPDGSLYVADFYNRIIGHYEVPLTHPGRDKERGRIWKIVKKQPQPKPAQDDAATIAKSLWLTSEQSSLSEADKGALHSHAKSGHAGIRLAAAHVMQRHPDPQWIADLVKMLHDTPAEDTHLRHTVRMALRAQLRATGAIAALEKQELPPAVEADLAVIARAVPSAEAAAFLFRWIQKFPGSREETMKTVTHIASYPGVVSSAQFADFIRSKSGDDIELQASLVEAMLSGLEKQHTIPDPDLRKWARELSVRLLDGIESKETPAWTGHPYPGAAPSKSPWVLEERPCGDGQEVMCISSLDGRGGEPESRTGVLRSLPFKRPEKLSFWLCGHRGYPDKAPHEKIYAALIDAKTGEQVVVAHPPRNDVAQQVVWTLPPGDDVILEIADGDAGDAYAWIGVTRFDPPVIKVGDFSGEGKLERRAVMASALARWRTSSEASDKLVDILCTAPLGDSGRKTISDNLIFSPPDGPVVTASAAADGGLEANAMPSARLQFLGSPGLPPELRRRIKETKGDLSTVIFREFPFFAQRAWAGILTSNPAGAELLLTHVKSGLAAPRILQVNAVVQKFAAHKIDITPYTKDLPPVNGALDLLIKTRLETFAQKKPDAALGQPVYAAHCAVCHKLGDLGNLVGPQLDGIGNRGADRLFEDTLDPNRNVDHAFRVRILKLKSGEVRAGLLRRKEAGQIVLADATGQESSVPESDVVEDTETPMSLMPAVFGESIPEDDYYRLMAFLLEQKAKP